MACAAIPGPSTSSGQPEIQPQPSSTFAPARKCVEPLKGPPINNMSGFMACHLELNYAEVSKFISHYIVYRRSIFMCVLTVVYLGLVFDRHHLLTAVNINGGHY